MSPETIAYVILASIVGAFVLAVGGIVALLVMMVRAVWRRVRPSAPSPRLATSPASRATSHRTRFADTDTPSGGTGSDFLMPALASTAVAAAADALLPEAPHRACSDDASSNDSSSWSSDSYSCTSSSSDSDSSSSSSDSSSSSSDSGSSSSD